MAGCLIGKIGADGIVEYRKDLALRFLCTGYSSKHDIAKALIAVALTVAVDPQCSGGANRVSGAVTGVDVVTAHAGQRTALQAAASPVAQLNAGAIVVHAANSGIVRAVIADLNQQVTAHFSVAAKAAAAKDHALLGGELDVAAIGLLAHHANNGIAVLDQLAGLGAKVVVCALLAGDLHAALDRRSITVQGGGAHPGADAALLLGVVAAQRPLTYTPAVLFLCGKAVGHPVKALAAVLSIGHDQAAAAAIVGAQLPVGNKLLYVDPGNALASQKLAVQMTDLSAAAEAHGVLGLALDHNHAGSGFNSGTGSRCTGLTAAHDDNIGGVLLCKFGDRIGSGAPALTFCGALAGSGADHRFALGLCHTVCNSILNGIRGNGRTGMTVDLGALSLQDLLLQLIANALAKALGFTGNINGHIRDALSVKGSW